MKKQQGKIKYVYSMWSKPKSDKVMRQKQEQTMLFNVSISGDNNHVVLLCDQKMDTKHTRICGKCEYSERVQRGNQCFYYCNRHFSRRTHNGKLKVKARRQACFAYKEEK